jgi:AcrR family transcriptional regulator
MKRSVQRVDPKATAPSTSVRGYLERIQDAGLKPVASAGPVGGSRGRLLVEAIKLFASHGFDACSVRDLAKAANLRAPAIYNHYGSKNDILVTAVDFILTEFYEVLFTNHKTTDARSLLIEILRRHALHGMLKQTMAKACYVVLNPDFMERVMPPKDRRRIAAAMAEYIRILRELLDEVLGLDDEIDSTLRAMLVHDLVDQTASRYDPKTGRTPEEEADKYVLLVTRMIGLAPKPRKPELRIT